MLMYHIGTAVLGSILITVASIPRAVIGFFNNKYYTLRLSIYKPQFFIFVAGLLKSTAAFFG